MKDDGCTEPERTLENLTVQMMPGVVRSLCRTLLIISFLSATGLGQDIRPEDDLIAPPPEDGMPVDPYDPVANTAPEVHVISRQPIFENTVLDRFDECLRRHSERAIIPIGGGAWHWFSQSMEGNPGGYGISAIPNTFFWYLNADPKAKLCSNRTVGAHIELRFRETGPMRAFIPNNVWLWEAYAYLEDDDWGVLKGGLLYKRFGLLWDGVFYGSTPYYDGLMLDADYGLSWESTREINSGFKIDRYVQFFFHEDNSNGSFPGADPESATGYTERNTGVFRFVPTWTRQNDSQVALGVSALIGQIESRRENITDQTLAAYAVDLSYTKGPWWAFIEGYQYFGVLNPKRYVSGGPSNRLTGWLGGLHYTHGPITCRCSYSNSFDSNPAGTQQILILGLTASITKNIDFYFEYVRQRIDGNAEATLDPDCTNSLNYIVNWHF